MSTLHHALSMLRPEVQQGDTADALVFWAMVDGLPVRPSSATVQILSPAGAELVAQVAVTPSDAPVGRLARSQTWPEATYPLGTDYSALWVFVVNGVTYSERLFFDVVSHRLPVMVHPGLMRDLAPNIGEQLRALGLDGNDDDLRVFAIHAHVHLCNRLAAAGWRASLVADRRRLIAPSLQWALHFAFGALSKIPGDLFDVKSTNAAKHAENLFGGLGRLKLDRDEDGTTSEAETEAKGLGQPSWGV